METKSNENSVTFDPESINYYINEQNQMDQHGAFILIDSNSSEIEEMSPELTNLAESLSQ